MSRADQRAYRSLKDKLRRQEEKHHREMNAKTRMLENLADSTLGELAGSFSNLMRLIELLRLVQEGAHPLKSPMGDGRGRGVNDPTGNAAAHGGERSRVETVDDRIETWADWVRAQLGDRGPLEEKPPQCANPDCPAYNLAQPWEAVVCGSCGEAFGQWKPTRDLTKVTVRCWSRSCPKRGHTGSCPNPGDPE